MTLLLLVWEFCLIGLLSVGGGMATVPFLSSLSLRYGWFTMEQLSTIIAVAQSTPGPIGVNMACYAGYLTAGVPGAILAPLALSLPAFLIILLLARVLSKWREHKIFKSIFYGLRPVGLGLIASVLLSLGATTLFPDFVPQWKAIALFAILTLGLLLPKLKNLPFPLFLLFAAGAGVLLQLGGA